MKKFILRFRSKFDPVGLILTIRTLGALLMTNVIMQFLLNNNSYATILKLLTLGLVALIMLILSSIRL